MNIFHLLGALSDYAALRLIRPTVSRVVPPSRGGCRGTKNLSRRLKNARSLESCDRLPLPRSVYSPGIFPLPECSRGSRRRFVQAANSWRGGGQEGRRL